MKLKMIGNKTNISSYQRFLELCSKSVKLKDIKPGFICYNNFQKFQITSEPYISKNSGGLVVDCRTTFSEGERDEFSVECSFFSLEDNNIVNGGYNLSRVFARKEDAIEYRNITKTYEYRTKSRMLCEDIDVLQYTIKPIPGEKICLKNSGYPVKEVTKFADLGK